MGSSRQNASRSSHSSTAAQAPGRSPSRRRSSATAAPSGPRTCGSDRVRADRLELGEQRRRGRVVAAREGQPRAAQQDADAGLHPGPAPGIGQPGLRLVPVAGVQRDLGERGFEPHHRHGAPPGHGLAAGERDRARLRGPAELVQRVRVVAVRLAEIEQVVALARDADRLAQLLEAAGGVPGRSRARSRACCARGPRSPPGPRPRRARAPAAPPRRPRGSGRRARGRARGPRAPARGSPDRRRPGRARARASRCSRAPGWRGAGRARSTR